jgi:hypothetical protein
VDKMIEVRYAGAVVGRSAVVRDADPQGLFVGVTEPMPVGTELILTIGDEAVPGKVAAVSESQELARCGMRVQFVDADEAVLFGMALAAAVAAPTPASGPASGPTVVGPTPSGRVAAAIGSGRVAAAVASGRVADAVAPVPSAGVTAAAAPVASGGIASAAEDEGEPEAASRSSAHVSSSSGDRVPASREPEVSGPVSPADGSGTGGTAGAGGGQGSGGRKNRRNRRR